MVDVTDCAFAASIRELEAHSVVPAFLDKLTTIGTALDHSLVDVLCHRLAPRFSVPKVEARVDPLQTADPPNRRT